MPRQLAELYCDRLRNVNTGMLLERLINLNTWTAIPFCLIQQKLVHFIMANDLPTIAFPDNVDELHEVRAINRLAI